MAEIKWIKITTNMFDDEKIKLIDAMPERDTIFYIWIRLLVQAGKTNAAGYIFLNENVPYSEEMLSTIFNRPLNSVRLALQALRDFGMIQVSENHLIKISNWEKHQNIEGMEKVREQNRLRKQKERTKAKELQSPAQEEFCGTKDIGDVTSQDSHSMSRDSHATEREEEIEIEREGEEEISLTNKALELCKYFEELKPGQSITKELATIKIFLQDYGFNWCKEALQKTVIGTGKFVPNYMQKILKDWSVEGKPEYKKAVGKDESISKINYSSKKESTFNAFKQRNYDFKDLEKKLLGWDKEG